MIKLYYKLFIINIILLLLYTTYYKNLFLINEFEKKIKRYIKFKRKKQIIKYYYEKDLPKIINYVQLLRNCSFQNKNYVYNPKISFIASVYNKEKYLHSFISSIQNQNLKEYELILVDDSSNDKSVNIIKKYMQKDKRIKLIKNTKNRGSLYTRYKGVQHSKGEFIIFVDSDDVVLKEGILRAYNYIKKNNLDIVQFNSVFQKSDTNIYISRRYYKYDSIIYQPILSYIFYYNKNKDNGAESNTALWDKLIKREVVLNTFYYIGNKFIKEKIIIENDVIILFSLFKNAKSFKYIDELGY
jgi:glycosyltransferase involved in cell wall biosynthesis